MKRVCSRIYVIYYGIFCLLLSVSARDNKIEQANVPANFWEVIATQATTSSSINAILQSKKLAQTWMYPIAQQICYGTDTPIDTQTESVISKNAITISSVEKAQTQKVLQSDSKLIPSIKLLSKLRATLSKIGSNLGSNSVNSNSVNYLPLEHSLMQMSSLPLTSRQKTAIQEYATSLKTQKPDSPKGQENLKKTLDIFQNWSEDDLYEIFDLYNQTHSEYSLEDVPFVIWISELYDLRMVTLPKLDFSNINFYSNQLTSTHINIAKQLLTKVLQLLFPDQIHNTKLKSITEEQALSLYKLTYTQTSADQQETDTKNFIQALKQIMITNKINENDLFEAFINNLNKSNQDSLSMAEPMPKPVREALNILNSKHLHTFEYQSYMKQLYNMQYILKTWDARNMEMLGNSTPAQYTHPTFGRGFRQTKSNDSTDDNSNALTSLDKFAPFTSDDKLLTALEEWSKGPLSHVFPSQFFALAQQVVSEDIVEKILGLNDVTTELLNILTYLNELYDTPEQQQKFKQQYFTLTLILPDGKELTMTDSLSTILAEAIYATDKMPASKRISVIYQALYSILLSAAFIDNGFAQKLLNNPNILFSNTHLVHERETHTNIVGYILSHVRQLLLSYARLNPEFLDFITLYYEDKTTGEITGHARIKPLSADSYTQTDFSTQYISGTDHFGIRELEPFNLNKNANNIYSQIHKIPIGNYALNNQNKYALEMMSIVPNLSFDIKPLFDSKEGNNGSGISGITVWELNNAPILSAPAPPTIATTFFTPLNAEFTNYYKKNKNLESFSYLTQEELQNSYRDFERSQWQKNYDIFSVKSSEVK